MICKFEFNINMCYCILFYDFIQEKGPWQKEKTAANMCNLFCILVILERKNTYLIRLGFYAALIKLSFLS